MEHINDNNTYCVRRVHSRSGHESTIARRIDTLIEAAELALRLTELQEAEFSRHEYDFLAEVE